VRKLSRNPNSPAPSAIPSSQLSHFRPCGAQRRRWISPLPARESVDRGGFTRPALLI
jgi:hypothetical protein